MEIHYIQQPVPATINLFFKGIPIKRRCVLVALVVAVGCKCDDTKCSTANPGPSKV